MNRAVAAIAVLGMLMALAGGASAASQESLEGGVDTPSDISVRVVEDQSQMDALIQRVAELEAR